MAGLLISLQNTITTYQVAFKYSYFSLMVLVPVTGWVADAYLGRYKAIILGFILSKLSLFLILVAYILLQFSWIPIAFTILYIALPIGLVGFGSFYANLLPFTLDQMIGATGEELSAAAHWFYWTFFVGLLVLCCLLCVRGEIFDDTLQSLVFLTLGTMCLLAGIMFRLPVPQVP